MSGKPQQQKKRPNPAGNPQQAKKQKTEEKKAPAQQQQKKPQPKGEQKQQKPKQQDKKQPQQQKKEKKQPEPEPQEEEEDVAGVPISDADMEAIQSIEQDLQKINVKIGREVRKIEFKYEKERKPLLAKRDKIYAQIPEFWMKVLLGNPDLQSMLTPADLEIASALESIKVENLPSTDGTDTGFILQFTFKPNPIIESKVVEKKFEVKPSADDEEDSDVVVTSSNIKFKDQKFVDENDDAFFVNWFTAPNQETDETLGQMFREDIYPNAFNLYMATLDGDDDDDLGMAFPDDEDGDDEGAAAGGDD